MDFNDNQLELRFDFMDSAKHNALFAAALGMIVPYRGAGSAKRTILATRLDVDSASFAKRLVPSSSLFNFCGAWLLLDERPCAVECSCFYDGFVGTKSAQRYVRRRAI